MFRDLLDRDVPRFTWRTVVLLVVLSPFAVCLLFFILRAEKAADWVQAVGSVIAILAAGYFPIRHHEIAQKKREEQTLGQLRVLVEDSYEKLWALTNCFLFPDRESRQISLYLQYGRAGEWPHIEMAVNQYPLELVPADHLSTLVVLRQAVSQALSICSQLHEWKDECSNPELIEMLKGRRDLLCLKKTNLPWPKGVREQQDYYHQERGARIEKRFNQPNMREYCGYKVYVRWPVPDPDECPESAYVVIIPPDKSEGLIRGYAEREYYPGWNSRDTAFPFVWRLACKLIVDHIGDAL